MICLSIIGGLSGTSNAQISTQDVKDINANIEWYDKNENCNTSSIATGSGSDPVTSGQPSWDINSGNIGVAFPSGADDDKIINAINNYINDKFPNSPFNGLGADFVAGAHKSNMNPMLAIAHIDIENGMATAPSGWHTGGSNNAFGRSATSSQPHTLSPSGRKIYKWSSWGASLNSNEDDWFTYMNRKLNTPGDGYYQKYAISQYIPAYAPPSENDTAKYIADMERIINGIISMVNDPNLSAADAVSSSSSTGPSQNTNTECGASSDIIGDFEVYNQYDPRWKDEPYGSKTISESGCFPAAMAMIINAFGKKNPDGTQVTPVDTAKFSFDNGHFANPGTSWSMPIPTGEEWGLSGEDMGKPVSQDIINKLNSGYLILITGRGEKPFTGAGHSIVLRGVKNGKLLIGDSGHVATNDQEWDPELITSMARNAWAFK